MARASAPHLTVCTSSSDHRAPCHIRARPRPEGEALCITRSFLAEDHRRAQTRMAARIHHDAQLIQAQC